MKKRIVILYGGPSNEHEVSINSAQNVLENIDKEKFEVTGIYISKNGICNFKNKKLEIEKVIPLLKDTCDMVLPILHGSFGEDGTLQEILEKEKIKFMGSGSIASKTAINKNISNKVFQENGVRVPSSQIITRKNFAININFPIIVKPISEGSSRGLLKVESMEDYRKNFDNIFKEKNNMLAQEFISGREFTCGVVEINGKEEALPVSEVILKSSNIFDYKAKYTPGVCEEITPANIEEKLKNKIQKTAIKCHKTLGCKSISRTDIIVTPSEEVYVLETNTMPGLTKRSFIPAQAREYGLSMKELICLLLDETYN